MKSWRAWLETIHHLALALWLGVVVAAGAFASIVFPTLKQLDPRLPAFEKHGGPHWRIAGGKLGQQIFLLTDIAQFACALVAVATLLCLFITLGASALRRRPANVVRAVAITLAFACAAGAIIIVGPAMNGALQSLWSAAEAGLVEEAAKHQSAIDELHPIASWLLSGTVFSLLIALIAGLWTLAKPWMPAADGAIGTNSPYPEPALLKGKRT